MINALWMGLPLSPSVTEPRSVAVPVVAGWAKAEKLIKLINMNEIRDINFEEMHQCYLLMIGPGPFTLDVNGRSQTLIKSVCRDESRIGDLF